MLYLSGVFALNHQQNKENGDWHEKALNWQKPFYLESINSLLKEEGIEKDNTFANKYQLITPYYAKTERALVDLLAKHEFKFLIGMKRDYPLTETELSYLFILARQLKDEEINQFLEKEYGFLFTGVKTKTELLVEERKRNGFYKSGEPLSNHKAFYPSTKWGYK